MEINDFSLSDPRANQVLQKLRGELATVTSFRYVGPPVSIRFPLANTSYEVRHLLRDVPDGFIVIDSDARIKRTPGTSYGKELAYLQADMANASATLAFGVLRESVTNVNPA